MGIVQQGIRQALVPRDVFFFRLRAVPVAPAALQGSLHIPFDAAVLADEHRNAGNGVLPGRKTVLQETAFGKFLIGGGKGCRILLVVVHVIDVRGHMEIAAGVDTGPGGVEELGHLIDDRQQIVVLLAGIGPSLVEGAPTYDGRVVEVPVQRLHPFRQKVLDAVRTAVVDSPVALFAPYDISHSVTVIQESFLKNLLMEPCPVEAGVHGEPDVLLQRLIGGSRIDAVRIEALVQHQPLEHGLAVDQEALPVQPDFPHAEIAVHPVFLEGKLQVIQPSGARFPEVQLGQRQFQDSVPRHSLYLCLAADFAFIKGFGAQSSRSLGHCVDGQEALRDVGIIKHLFDMGLGEELQPYGLPDSRGPGVIAAAGVVVAALFSLALRAAAVVVRHIQGQHVLPLSGILGDVKGERDISALVAPGLLPVYPEMALVIHRAEVQAHDSL